MLELVHEITYTLPTKHFNFNLTAMIFEFVCWVFSSVIICHDGYMKEVDRLDIQLTNITDVIWPDDMN